MGRTDRSVRVVLPADILIPQGYMFEVFANSLIPYTL